MDRTCFLGPLLCVCVWGGGVGLGRQGWEEQKQGLGLARLSYLPLVVGSHRWARRAWIFQVRASLEGKNFLK
jgi:hypothetical protein